MIDTKTYGIDVFGYLTTEPYYDGTGRGFVKEPSYVRLTPEKTRNKISLLCQYIRDRGVEGLEDYEEAVTESLNRGVHGPSPVYTPHPPHETPSCTTQNGLDRPSKRLSSVDLEGSDWKSKDRAFLKFTDRWLLASDDELQWVLYHRKGSQWKAARFPTTRETLLTAIRERIPEGISPEALQQIQSWPDAFRHWLQPKGFKHDRLFKEAPC